MILMDLVKRAGWRAGLVPFAKCVCVYWAVAAAAGGAGGAGAVGALTAAKCAPVLCLLVLVLAQRTQRRDPSARRYGALVGAGLAASALGDALLQWERLRGGMAAFGLAQLLYAAAFGRRGRGAAAGGAAAAAAAAYCAALRPPPPLRALVPLYALLLAGMAWRGAARARRPPQAASARCSAAGGALFMLSDALLAWSLFNGPVPYKQLLVMSTYYAAQLLIALSALLLPADPPAAPAPAPAPAPAAPTAPATAPAAL